MLRKLDREVGLRVGNAETTEEVLNMKKKWHVPKLQAVRDEVDKARNVRKSETEVGILLTELVSVLNCWNRKRELTRRAPSSAPRHMTEKE